MVDVQKHKDVLLVNFKLHRKVVEVLDQMVQTGLFKTRVDVILSALRSYELFKETWDKWQHN
jgi:Arc/MetJ-type ribon-helix-helix transcriptional regulator